MFFKGREVMGIFIIVAGVALYLIFPTTKSTDRAKEDIKSVYSRDDYSKAKALSDESSNEYALKKLYALGDNATPEDIRRINFYERGGLISSTPEIMEISEEYADEIREEVHQMEEQGFYMVESVFNLEDSVGITLKLKKILQGLGSDSVHDGLDNVKNHLSFPPVDLKNSLFSDIPRMTSRASGTINYGRWSTISHYFKDPELGIITLDEQQAGPGGNTIHVLPEELNEQVNGHPAIYAVEVAKNNGQALTNLRWENNDVMYTLSVQQNSGTNEEIKAYVFELANSLPAPSTE